MFLNKGSNACLRFSSISGQTSLVTLAVVSSACRMHTQTHLPAFLPPTFRSILSWCSSSPCTGLLSIQLLRLHGAWVCCRVGQGSVLPIPMGQQSPDLWLGFAIRWRFLHLEPVRWRLQPPLRPPSFRVRLLAFPSCSHFL